MKKQEATLFTFHILYHQCLLDIEQFIYSVNINRVTYCLFIPFFQFIIYRIPYSFVYLQFFCHLGGFEIQRKRLKQKL